MVEYKLDKQQRAAVYHDGHSLVSACPGSGKTRVLSCKAAHLLSNVDNRVLSVTFTKDAAFELRKRILEMAQPGCEDRVFAGTFHSIALGQFRKGGMRPKLISPAQQRLLQRQAWRKAVTEDGYREWVSEAQREIEDIKSSMEAPPDSSSPVGRMFNHYQNLLSAMGAFDFADIMLEAVRLMKSGELKPVNATHMLVDESQDMDEVQLAWIKEHVKNGVITTLVGDDDQSIYGFRRAMGYRGMIQFKKFAKAKHMVLGTNYRSGSYIIRSAADLIECNEERVDKVIRPHRKVAGEIDVYAARNVEDEGNELARRILESGEPGTWAVLSRTNTALKSIQSSLQIHQIPNIIIGGSSFWDEEGPATLAAILKGLVVKDGAGAETALHWLGVPGHIINNAKGDGGGWSGMRTNLVRHLDGMDEASRKAVKDFIKLRDTWEQNLDKGRNRLVISGVADWMKASIEAAAENETAEEKQRRKSADATIKRKSKRARQGKANGEETAGGDAESLADVARFWIGEAERVLNSLKGDVLSRIMLVTTPSDKDREGVQLMTIHNSKGLEFPNVWVTGVNTGKLPLLRGADDPESEKLIIAEERRLAYVAMTRAQDYLCLAYDDSEMTPSQFIAEAGLRT